MKILYVIDSLIGGGAEKLIYDIAPRINIENECQVLLLTLERDKYSDSLRKKGIKIVVVPCDSHIKRIYFIKNYIEKNMFDIVHVNLFPVLYYCAIAKVMMKKNKPKFVFTEHNTDNRRRHVNTLRPIEKWVYSKYDSVISISSKTQEALLKWIYPKKIEKYCVINNGIPLDDFYNAERYEKREIADNIKENDIVLCMVGSFTKQKNYFFMIKVMKNLSPKYHLLCVGEGALMNDVKNKVQVEGLSERVHFLGFRKDVASIIKSADISVVPSKWEGFGLVAVEAMACMKPIVISDVPGLSEIVGKYGLHVKCDNVKGFVDNIVSLENKDKYKKYLKLSLERSKKYDLNIMIDKYLSLYRKLNDGGRIFE